MDYDRRAEQISSDSPSEARDTKPASGDSQGPLDSLRANADMGSELSVESSLEDVRSWLLGLQQAARDVGALDKATLREQALQQLGQVKVVSSAAKMVDAALNGGAPKADGGALQGKSLALEDPEPWPEPVDGKKLLAEFAETFTRFLALPDGAATALSLWAFHAHSHDTSSVSPVLALTSPEKRCGKTTLLELLSAVVPRPLPASNVTAATVFRVVQQRQPTLLIDEADTFLKRGDELRGILNSGHRRSLAYVVRTVGDEHEPRQFRTWAPKAIALIGELPDTLQDRSIEIRMRRRAPDEQVERLRRDRLGELEPLQRKAWRWAQGHFEVLENAEPSIPAGLHDRKRDNWRPLLAIADAAGGPWPERARMAAEALWEGERNDRSLGTRLLADVQMILEEHTSDRIRSKKLVAKLSALEEAPWAEYKGRGLSAVSLATFLRSFDISSQDIRFPSGVYKGYRADDFGDAFRRYLDTPPSGGIPSKDATTQQHPRNRGPDGDHGRNTEHNIAGQESPGKPYDSGNVAGVAGRERGLGEGKGSLESNGCTECGEPIGPTATVCGRCKSKKQAKDRC